MNRVCKSQNECQQSKTLVFGWKLKYFNASWGGRIKISDIARSLHTNRSTIGFILLKKDHVFKLIISNTVPMKAKRVGECNIVIINYSQFIKSMA